MWLWTVFVSENSHEHWNENDSNVATKASLAAGPCCCLSSLNIHPTTSNGIYPRSARLCLPSRLYFSKSLQIVIRMTKNRQLEASQYSHSGLGFSFKPHLWNIRPSSVNEGVQSTCTWASFPGSKDADMEDLLGPASQSDKEQERPCWALAFEETL